jgi:hypothetical protein
MATIKQFNNLAEEIEYGALANSCGFGQDGSKSSFRCIADEMIRLRKEVEELKSQLAVEEVEVVVEVEEYTEEDIAAQFNKEADKYGMDAHQRERGLAVLKKCYQEGKEYTETTAMNVFSQIVREHQELKRKVQLQELGGYYCHTRPAPDCEINTDDAAFDHYWSVQDKDLTLWKVPRHLADVKSAQTSYHGAVEQAFYDECFGEEYGKLKWMRVREMTQADLIKGGWQPKADDEEKYTNCDDCGRFCYTGGDKHPDGYVCEDCEEEEEDDE